MALLPKQSWGAQKLEGPATDRPDSEIVLIPGSD